MLQKTHCKPLAVRSLVLTALCAMLFSFSVNPGADSFTIYLDNTLMLEQYVTRNAVTKTLPLNESSGGETLKIYYSHCGKTGKDREISIRDGQNKALKTWHFPDAAEGASAGMNCRLKEVLALQKTGKNMILSLVYSSKELPDGRLLANIATGNNDKASLK
jgi:hypothetical protein